MAATTSTAAPLPKDPPSQTIVDEFLRTSNPPAQLVEAVRRHAGFLLTVLVPNPRGAAPGHPGEAIEAAASSGDDELHRAVLAWSLWRSLRPDTDTARDMSIQALQRFHTLTPRWSPAEIGWLVDQIALIDNWWFLKGRAPIALAPAERLELDQLRIVEPSLQRFAAVLRSTGFPMHADTNRDLVPVHRRVAVLIRRLHRDSPPIDLLIIEDALGAACRQALADRDAAAVAAVLDHLAEHGEKTRPTARWLTANRRLRAERPDLIPVARVLLDVLRNQPDPPEASSRPDIAVLVRASDNIVFRGAVSTVADLDEPWTVPLLGDVGLHCGVGFGGRGGYARCSGVATTVITALAVRAIERTSEAGTVVTELDRLKRKIGNKTLQKALTAALDQATGTAGLTASQLLERAVPRLGLDADGRAEVEVGDHVAMLELTGSSTAPKLAMSWRTPAGRTVKAVPAEVKEHHPQQLSELRSLAKEVRQTVSAQRARLEDLMAVERVWSGSDWSALYLDQPLVGLTARGLIWQVLTPDADAENASGPWTSGLPERRSDTWVLRGLDDAVVDVANGDRVRLWHPVRESLAEVRAWRARLTDAGAQQPFKQAFREIYLLTPAEETTGTYSNRFAAHILRYPQAGALMRTRGWSATHLGYWEGGFGGQATNDMTETGWRVDFYYELVEREEDGGAEVSLCSTDQVRFCTRDGRGADAGWTVRRLCDVPPLVFSEGMRDVDLFVGVTSVAAEPDWSDRGTERFGAYWHDASFGDLGESAQIRREALARLLPRMTIADRAELTDRFLVVKGQIRDYKIHLGSGNILMSPADTYLCILQARGGRISDVYLPFESDGGRLSLIVSKALLLAEDTAITDPTIVVQLQHGLDHNPG